MAGDWIKFEKATIDKPEVYEMADVLGIDPDAVIGKLLRVWNWFDDQSKDGNAPVTVRALLDRYAGVTGFTQAMENCGWLASSDRFISIPNFDRHNGQTSKTRALSAKRAGKSRLKSNAKSNAVSVTSALPEKRREEKSINRERESVREESEKTETRHRRPTIEQARSAASGIGITPAKAEEWWNAREASEWLKGMAGGGTAPVGTNWQADMTTYCKRGNYGQTNGNHREDKKQKEFPEQIKIKHL